MVTKIHTSNSTQQENVSTVSSIIDGIGKEVLPKVGIKRITNTRHTPPYYSSLWTKGLSDDFNQKLLKDLVHDCKIFGWKEVKKFNPVELMELYLKMFKGFLDTSPNKKLKIKLFELGDKDLFRITKILVREGKF